MSFLADYSVDAPAINRPEFTFDKKFLGAFDNEKFFTLSTWKEKYLKDYSGDLLLQMDIEGAEYPVILSTPSELLSQFRILVIEVHYLDRLFDPCCFDLFASWVDKILASFSVVHIHPNNFYGSAKRGSIEIPRLLEFTFLNKSRITNATPARKFPHPLIRPERTLQARTGIARVAGTRTSEGCLVVRQGNRLTVSNSYWKRQLRSTLFRSNDVEVGACLGAGHADFAQGIGDVFFSERARPRRVLKARWSLSVRFSNMVCFTVSERQRTEGQGTGNWDQTAWLRFCLYHPSEEAPTPAGSPPMGRPDFVGTSGGTIPLGRSGIARVCRRGRCRW